MANESARRKIGAAAKAKARHKRIRKALRDKPTIDDMIASGECDEPIPQGVVLDALELSAQLREAREARGLTLAELARRSGIDVPALSRLETGRQNNPTLHTILRYVHALGKRLTWTIADEAAEGHCGGGNKTLRVGHGAKNGRHTAAPRTMRKVGS